MGRAIEAARQGEDGTPRIDPDVYVPALLTDLTNNLTNNASLFYRQNFGVGLTDWRIMYRLSTEPWVTAHRISTASALDKSVVSRSVAWMEKRGLVSVHGDAGDARRRLIALTPAGRDLHDRITVVALQRERNFLSVLSEAETETLIDLIGRLRGNLRAFSKPVAIPPPGPQHEHPVP
ncbi:MarR family winged helix-turn-helix transcriptional regulator [Methylobacterium trifolii]|uniref:HTH marR-type domain-containing protein n=1 Tax=Methylobacterium trifolii TaxID=1003092 RepID=A0ABQ4TVJ0_9HYPH|nr:MarR family winged helix-turn-helix transcriptional regulator [Methylobacterium trifolii]GJE59296.1 hypothetical protein MPOCJGCO_1384 [Methylobacterium trifolii]